MRPYMQTSIVLPQWCNFTSKLPKGTYFKNSTDMNTLCLQSMTSLEKSCTYITQLIQLLSEKKNSMDQT